MNKQERKKLILDFINGPLEKYLTGDISFGKFKELTNDICGTDFCYSDLYPSYLFNASLDYEHPDINLEEKCLDVIPNTFIACGEGYGEERQYCSDYCYKKAQKG